MRDTFHSKNLVIFVTDTWQKIIVDKKNILKLEVLALMCNQRLKTILFYFLYLKKKNKLFSF